MPPPHTRGHRSPASRSAASARHGTFAKIKALTSMRFPAKGTGPCSLTRFVEYRADVPIRFHSSQVHWRWSVISQGGGIVWKGRMAAAPQDQRQSIDYAWREADRCAALAQKAGSEEAKGVYWALRESWIRIANSLESADMTGVPSPIKVDPGKSRYRLPRLLEQNSNSSRGNSAVTGRSCGDAITNVPSELQPSVAAALAHAKWCRDQAAKATPPQRDTYLRLRDGWIQIANEMQMLDRAERAMLLSIDNRRHRKTAPNKS
jgi:hypothetical protein